MDEKLQVRPSDGARHYLPNALQQLSSSLRDRAVLPEMPDYDSARRVWNGCVDKRPAVILPCMTAEDVVEGITLARSTGLLLAVRGGGHNIAGASVCDGGIVIDLSALIGSEYAGDSAVTSLPLATTWLTGPSSRNESSRSVASAATPGPSSQEIPRSRARRAMVR